MYTTTDYSIPSSTGIFNDYNDTYLAAALGNSLNIPPSPHSPYSSGSSVSSLSPGSISPVLLSPVSPTSSISSSISPDSEGEDFPMDRLGDIKNQLNMFPPPMSAGQFIEKNAFQSVDGHIKRPSNNFILFRKIAHDQKNQTQALSHYNEREWSQIIGKIWKTLSDKEMSTYKKLGEEVANIHKSLYPDYKYQPKRDKAAWKHYTVQNVTKKPRTKKDKRLQKQKQQTRERQEKPLEIMTNFPQQQQLIPSNPLTYNLPSETPVVSTTDIDTNVPTDGFSFEYTGFDNNFTIDGLTWIDL